MAVEGTSGNWGFFYHFLDPATGTRAMPPKFWGSELSTIDTALLMDGVMFVRNYFNEPHEESQIRLRVDATYLVGRRPIAEQRKCASEPLACCQRERGANAQLGFLL